MKKITNLILALSVFMSISVTASAYDGHDNRNNHNERNWHRTHHNDRDSERNMPFRWHERSQNIREHHHLERLHDREWEHRFPGLQAYTWSDHKGFWHHGNFVQHAVLFFDREHELVSIGYMANGVFIHFRADHESYENHDSFFSQHWRR